MGITEVAILSAGGAIAAIIQHSQTIFQAFGIIIPPAWKRIVAGGLSFAVAAIIILVAEKNGGDLSSHSLNDWVSSFLIALGGSQAIFALVLPKIGVAGKE